jgi:2-polyprenyl-3-methyl-5-hydroxy-6-metoxy-1,4-benzoquinol methylase
MGITEMTEAVRAPRTLDIARLKTDAYEFLPQFRAARERCGPKDFPWYPWESLGNFEHLHYTLTGPNRDLATLTHGLPVADVGAADGDVSFFLERQGLTVDLIDNGPTNYNGLQGARLLKAELGSNVSIHEIDLDSQFRWPRERYGLVFFLGILYHLKNPFYALESMANVTRYAFISTRIARLSPDKKTSLEKLPLAYLVSTTECNNDATNYWIFSDTGLKRILDRAGWEVLDYRRVGNLSNSDPAHSDADERAFALIRSRLA